MVSPHLVQIFTLYFCLYCSILSLHLPHATSLSFNFNFSQPGGFNAQDFSFQGDAYFDSQMIELTTNDRSKGIHNSVGRVSYAQSVPLWDNVTGELASFTTTFSFQIKTDDITNTSSGDGMAFFLGHYPSSIPFIANGNGGGLGLFNVSVATNATGEDRMVAVEFDTFLNQGIDTSNNHMGIDVNTIVSQAYTNTTVPGKNLTSGLVMTCRASYDKSTKNFAADLQIGDLSYHVVTTVDLRQLLPSVVAIGFSGATGVAVELHRILSWSFNSTLDGPPPPAPAPQGHHASSSSKGKINTGIRLGIFLIVLLAIALSVFVCKRLWNKCTAKKLDIRIAGGQLEHFGYRKLELATNRFAKGRKLGEDGSASVYHGKLTNPNRSVEIKKFEERESGRKAFEAELKITSHLTHPNLVNLKGLCYSDQRVMSQLICSWMDERRTRLLLVYEHLPEDSRLDKLLGARDRPWPWANRYLIIGQIASALQYLHETYRQQQLLVVHNDIQTSNIFLDSSSGSDVAKVGVVARCTDDETESNISRNTDVYNFGQVLLEIVSGQDLVCDQQNMPTPLPIWVWDKHCRHGDEILHVAADQNLLLQSSRDEQGQMKRVLQVGLWCTIPDTSKRLTIAQAIEKIQSNDENVEIPPADFPKSFTYNELAGATNNFEIELGHGACAIVYQGRLGDPYGLVAVKKFRPETVTNDLRMVATQEIRIISRLRHPNLVKFAGWCIDEAKKQSLLVYELVSGGTLEEHLHKGKSWLSWTQRYDIILHLCRALHYLHAQHSPVLHGDIKASNILLDSQYVAKLADFGLARLLDPGKESKTTVNVVGTTEYLDPNLVETRKRNRQSDVYSFGIVLLEIVSGQCPEAVLDERTIVNRLVASVTDLHRRNAILDAAHKKLRGESTSDAQVQMKRVLLVGLWCTHPDPSKRPPIAKAMKTLQSEGENVEIPALPEPVAGPSSLAETS